MKRFSFAFLLALCFAGVASATHTCTTCYIDYQNGNDTWDGTSKTFTSGTTGPWKHAPGMKGLSVTGSSTGDGCASVCLSQVPAPGDKYILKGGVIWPYTSLPWIWSGSGNATTSTYGCTGTGCIYIGYDATWNLGIVNSVTLTRDFCGWSPASPPTVSLTGGGGASATATALVIPAAAGTAEPQVAGCIYHVNTPAQGSGYTSNPACSISGTGGTGATCVADIFRPVIDAGEGSSIDWPVGSGTVPSVADGPGLTVGGSYIIVDHLEIRNILQVARAVNGVPDGIITGFINLGNGGAGHSTVENSYLHGRFTDCVLNSCNANTQEQADNAINVVDVNDEFIGNTIENGDAYQTGTASTACITNTPCTFSEHDIHTGAGGTGGSGEMQGNFQYSTRWMTHWGGSAGSTAVLIHNNEMWNVLYDAGNSHVNCYYLQFTTGTVYFYNNIFHNCVSGSSNQQQMGNGTTQYIFNNISWAAPGTGTVSYGIDTVQGAGASGAHFHFYNNSMIYASFSGATPTPGQGPCLSSGSGGSFLADLFVIAQNNFCISNQNPYFQIQAAGPTWTNQAGSSVTANIQAASQVSLVATTNSQGYTSSGACSNNTLGPCGPTANTNDTYTFASGSGTANLTSLCTGNLVPLCSDINGNARPSSGGWQAGAINFTSGTPTAGNPTFSPVAGTYTSTQNVTISSSAATIICYNNTGATITIGGAGSCPGGSTLYTGPVSVPSTQTLYAVAGGTGYLDSSQTSAAYTINLSTNNVILNGTVTISGTVVLP